MNCWRKWRAVRSLVGSVAACVAGSGVAVCGQSEDWGSARVLEVADGGRQEGGFTRLELDAIGITFTNWVAQERSLTNQVLLNASGVAAGDIDGDGWCDLIAAGLDTDTKIYRNLGDWKFEEVTRVVGLGDREGKDDTGVVLADLDNDGDMDLIIGTLGQGTDVYQNDGEGRFSRWGEALNGKYGAMSLALADVDKDGDLDLYITNYRVETLRDQPDTQFTFRMVNGRPRVRAVNGRPITDPEVANRFDFTIGTKDGVAKFRHVEKGEPDAFYLNDGTGVFQQVPFEGGRFLDKEGKPLLKPPFDWGLSAMFRDLNGDGWPDLYVCNDFDTPERVWINQGDGIFRAIDVRGMRHFSYSSMGVDVADIDGDGHEDIFVVEMLSRDHYRRLNQFSDQEREVRQAGDVMGRLQVGQNTLYLNRGDGSYAEVAMLAGLDATEWSWNPVFLDVDLDGDMDVLVTNGFERDGLNTDLLRQLERAKAARRIEGAERLRLRKIFPRLETRDLAYRNDGDLQFREVGAEWGLDVDGVSHGTALADLDNDGDRDVIVAALNEPIRVFRNEAGRNRIAVRLKGTGSNRFGVGARVALEGAGAVQWKEMISGGRYLSSDEPKLVFAAVPGAERLRVMWPGGGETQVAQVRPNMEYWLVEPDGGGSEKELIRPHKEEEESWFEDWSSRLNHVHVENAFDDFQRQPSLPRHLSRPGPGVAWGDLDGDGWDDLVIGSGAGGRLSVFRNLQGESFEKVPGEGWGRVLEHDLAGLVLETGGPKGGRVLAARSHFDASAEGGSSIGSYGMASGEVVETPIGGASSAGPLALGDVDGDQQLELFVGGRCIPGRYPEPAASSIYRAGAEGRWGVDEPLSEALKEVGLVNSAVWCDLTGDGMPELVLACELGPVRVFENRQGQLEEQTEAWGLAASTGRWMSVAAGDFNGDGRMDLVAGNWGRNHELVKQMERPVHFYSGDLDGDQRVEVLTAVWASEREEYVPWAKREEMLHYFPPVGFTFRTVRDYARASMKEILQLRRRGTTVRRDEFAVTESSVFINEGGRMRRMPLPMEAQFTPVHGISVADFDGDGREDLFLSQNYFSLPANLVPQDAGLGLLLKGTGEGTFEAVGAGASGIQLLGGQRGCAAADFDRDGRVDLVVTENGRQSSVFRNRSAVPGLRVRLEGGKGNRAGLGAVVRAGNGETWGPAKLVDGGSGYASQGSPVLVVAGQPAWVEVIWPGGDRQVNSVPGAARELVVKKRP